MGVGPDMFAQDFGSLFGFFSNRFLDLGAAFEGILSSPLTRIEKAQWAELGRVNFRKREEVVLRKVEKARWLRLVV